MWKRCLVAVTVFVCMAADSHLVFAQSVVPQAAQKKDPRELVIRIKNASIDELKILSFFELNVLKNAVYASKGYKFAEDRPWLQELFCGVRAPQKKSGKKKDVKITPSETSNALTASADVWNLDAYAFPACREGGALDEDQKKAIANIRVATFKKIESLGSMGATGDALFRKAPKKKPGGYYVPVLGKQIRSESEDAGSQATIRDFRGYQRMLFLIKNIDEDFDAMELLGLYAGDVIFLRNIIEAKYGKPFSGILGWEISQVTGITEQKPDYDPKKLPIKVQTKLQMLDSIAQKILSGDLNDVPSSLKSNPVQLFEEPYTGGAC